MSESIANGISITNSCYECQVIALSVEEGYPEGKCFTCQEEEEARADDNAHNLHEDERLGESGKCMSIDTSDAPSASEWVASQTYVRPAGKKAVMFEKWDDDNPFRLVELSVEFIDEDEPQIRYEFLPPIAQLQDGGVYEELWELDDQRQRAREVQCQWCNLLTPKAFNDCTSCDKPLEHNVR
jgi:hypothetical protein